VIRNWLRNFMIGRYGPDHLYIALFVFAVLISIASRIANFSPLLFLSYAILIFAMFRFFSKNIQKRRAENDRFLRFWGPISNKIKRKVQQFKSRKTHKFFTCPACKNTLRVPKGKGKIQITCPKCGERFTKKT